MNHLAPRLWRRSQFVYRMRPSVAGQWVHVLVKIEASGRTPSISMFLQGVSGVQYSTTLSAIIALMRRCSRRAWALASRASGGARVIATSDREALP